MNTNIQIKTISGKLLFELEIENNSIKRTIEEAIKQKIDLRNADLRGAVLIGANLSRADLSRADLSRADLRGADLRGAVLICTNLSGTYLIDTVLICADLRDADLRGAVLIGANLSRADLNGADLRGANLRSADLIDANLSGVKNKETANLPIYNKWSYSIKGDIIQIGCKEKTIEEWDKWFNSKEEYSTKRGTEDFYRIQATYLALKAYKEHMDKFNK